ncbi:MAG: hypothetical protein EXS08_10775 [Planctomycetes bacterium]|nr:hypothetical protein [Planctomycetota bacterium]
MDGLALLCNLFADGPVTLERLRRARVDSLVELERVVPGQLAEWLHASVPQARSFAEEARKLARRIGPERAAYGLAEAPPQRAAQAESVALPAPRASAEDGLRPGLFPGLDEAVCTRLRAQGVRTVAALIAGAGLALARRTGIPYLALLALARNARRRPATSVTAAKESAGSPEPALAEVELVPRLRAVAARVSVPEPTRSDEFTLPLAEPGVAGPFG